jgi:hypothetical protein
MEGTRRRSRRLGRVVGCEEAGCATTQETLDRRKSAAAEEGERQHREKDTLLELLPAHYSSFYPNLLHPIPFPQSPPLLPSLSSTLTDKHTRFNGGTSSLVISFRSVQ